MWRGQERGHGGEAEGGGRKVACGKMPVDASGGVGQGPRTLSNTSRTIYRLGSECAFCLLGTAILWPIL